MHPLRAALEGLIDYAGLFPPAALSLGQALANMERYAAAPARWALGRFILRLDHLAGLHARLDAAPSPARSWAVSVLADASEPLERTIEIVSHFAERVQPLGVRVAAIEFGGAGVAEIEGIGRLVPAAWDRFVEAPAAGATPALLDAVAAAGCFAKIRTGGVTADRFPPSSELAAFMAACASRSLPFKATAGLHHPLRGRYRLTYEPDARSATMHGFVNLVLAATLLQTGRGGALEAEILLDAGDPAQFSFADSRLCWGGRAFSTADIASARQALLRSIGSCSFDEPAAELRQVFGFDVAASSPGDEAAARTGHS
jgi:hypothetical protein